MAVHAERVHRLTVTDHQLHEIVAQAAPHDADEGVTQLVWCQIGKPVKRQVRSKFATALFLTGLAAGFGRKQPGRQKPARPYLKLDQLSGKRKDVFPPLSILIFPCRDPALVVHRPPDQERVALDILDLDSERHCRFLRL